MLALDKDKRNRMRDMVHYSHGRNGAGRGELRDGRELKKYTEGWIQLSAKQILSLLDRSNVSRSTSWLSVLCLSLRGPRGRICRS